MSELVEKHVNYLEVTGAPPNTIKGRKRVLRLIDHPETATREQLEEWWLTRQHLSPSTRANDLAHLRAFYKWANRWEHRTDNPTLRLDAPKVPNGIPRPISRTDLEKIKHELSPDLRRAVCLGAYAGLRVMEAAALDWADIDLETRRARILGKGNKWRTVALGVVLLDELLPNTGGNVVTAGGEQQSAARLERRVNRAIRALDVDATFHQLRHRYGTLAYQATRDLIAVGRQMGHSSPVTTAIYAAASSEVDDQIASAVTR